MKDSERLRNMIVQYLTVLKKGGNTIKVDVGDITITHAILEAAYQLTRIREEGIMPRREEP